MPVAPELVDFLGEVATAPCRSRHPSRPRGADSRQPARAVAPWQADRTKAGIPGGDLRVVAGDLDGDSVTSWLKTLLADAFYWTDNDLVVQTRSMYGGAPRDASATFVLDQGGKVSHFDYFSNERTAEAIVNALMHEQPHGFRKIGPLSWAADRRSRARPRSGPAASITRRDRRARHFGSNLKVTASASGWLALVNGVRTG